MNASIEMIIAHGYPMRLFYHE